MTIVQNHSNTAVASPTGIGGPFRTLVDSFTSAVNQTNLSSAMGRKRTSGPRRQADL